MSRGQTARLRSWSLCGTGTRRGRVSCERASSRQTCTGPGTLRGPVCRVPANWAPMCTGRAHVGALLAGGRKLGPDECHHWLDHVRNCETCTGPFVKTLIARLIYLVLCGIRLIAHGTRLTRVCIFRYTWAGSCHGWNVYGTRRPRVCGVPCVTSSRVPAGRAPRTHDGRVCRPPANWGQACTAGAPPGTRPARVSCNRANSRQECTGTHRQRTHGARVYAGHANSRQECTRGVVPPCGLFLERPVLPQLAFQLLEDWDVLLARLADDGKCDRVVICVTH